MCWRATFVRGWIRLGQIILLAWAGIRSISKVEVQIGKGEWQLAKLADALAKTTWRQWYLDWDAPAGIHIISVRATDGDGVTQTEQSAPVNPDGATGYHFVAVNVA